MKHRMTVSKPKEKWPQNSEKRTLNIGASSRCGLAAPACGFLTLRAVRECVSVVLSYTLCDDAVHQPQECSTWSSVYKPGRHTKASYIQVVPRSLQNSQRESILEHLGLTETTIPCIWSKIINTTFLRQPESRPLLLPIILKI